MISAESVNEKCLTCHTEKRGPVPLGARAGPRELPQLPRPPRLEPREAARGQAALPLPALPPEHPPPGLALRRHQHAGRPVGDQPRGGARVQELPPERPRRQRAVRTLPGEVAMTAHPLVDPDPGAHRFRRAPRSRPRSQDVPASPAPAAAEMAAGVQPPAHRLRRPGGGDGHELLAVPGVPRRARRASSFRLHGSRETRSSGTTSPPRTCCRTTRATGSWPSPAPSASEAEFVKIPHRFGNAGAHAPRGHRPGRPVDQPDPAPDLPERHREAVRRQPQRRSTTRS